MALTSRHMDTTNAPAAVMFLPIRLIWNLQIAPLPKIGVGLLFATALVCILFSTIRIVQIGIRDGKPMTPEPKWLTLWTIIECSTGTVVTTYPTPDVANIWKAVIIGCCPQFATLGRKKMDSSNAYNAEGYIRQSASRPTTFGRDDIRLKSMVTSGNQGEAAGGAYWGDGHSSQEELAKNQEGIRVTTTLRQDDERRRAECEV